MVQKLMMILLVLVKDCSKLCSYFSISLVVAKHFPYGW